MESRAAGVSCGWSLVRLESRADGVSCGWSLVRMESRAAGVSCGLNCCPLVAQDLSMAAMMQKQPRSFRPMEQMQLFGHSTHTALEVSCPPDGAPGLDLCVHVPLPTKLIAAQSFTIAHEKQLRFRARCSEATFPGRDTEAIQGPPSRAATLLENLDKALRDSFEAGTLQERHCGVGQVEDSRHLDALLHALTTVGMQGRPKPASMGCEDPSVTSGCVNTLQNAVPCTSNISQGDAEWWDVEHPMPTPPPALTARDISIARATERRQAAFAKTELCSFYAVGRCARGTGCRFAHGSGELEVLPDLTKTTICRKWARQRCPLSAAGCRFAHGLRDLRHVATEALNFEEPSAPPTGADSGRLASSCGVPPVRPSTLPITEGLCAWAQLNSC